MTLRGWSLTTTVLAALAHSAAVSPAFAQPVDDATTDSVDETGAPPPPPSEPMLLEADDLTVDDTLDLIIASGKVRLAREGRVVLADSVTYNRLSERVTATGNVVVIEESGDTFFGDYAELEDDLAEGFIDRVGALLIDDSRLAGRQGIRRGGGITTLTDGVYSPCLPCAENPDRPLIWQIRASEIEHDAESLDIIFRNVFLDFYGIPVLYTPYFSTPDPRVRSRTGWLTPAFGSTSTLGQFFDLRYFVDIAPEQDLTLRAMPTGNRSVLVGAEYRRRFENAKLFVDATVNQSELRDDEDSEFRGHVFADFRYDFDENWRLTSRIERTTDDTYLRDFNISEEDILESDVRVEGFFGLDYYVAEAISFQDLRGNVEDEPLILPWMRSSIVRDSNWLLGGQIFADTEFLYLSRPGEGLRSTLDGTDTLRASTDIGWRKTSYTPSGIVFDVELANRISYWATKDLYDDRNGPVAAATDTTAFLTVPRLHAVARYPFVRSTENTTQIIEPILAATISPRYSQSDYEDIPRNDSIAPELDEISIFQANRFPGIDRFDGGSRLTVGGRYMIDDGAGRSGSILLAQSFRTEESDLFDIGSGLGDTTSDIVGRITASPGTYLNLDYRFRLDNETFEARRHELTASSTVGPISLSGRYTYLADGADLEREEMAVYASAPIYNGWTTRGAYVVDLQQNAVTDWSASLRYACECVVLDITYREQPVIDDQSILVRLALTNLGDFDFNFGIGGPEE